ncbi:RNase H domain-containing protein [Trichonephila clavipes]|nr:RNase H domain-containing protein [Trichonephila clavipes]
MRKHGFIDFNVDTSTPLSCITPIDSFNHVEFRKELLTSTPKNSSHPELLRQLALERKPVYLQWIPSHVGVPGNEAADELAVRGCDLPNPSSTVLTHTKIHSFQRNKMNLTWRNPPAHHWYAAKSPGLFIQCRSFRAHQVALARLRSGQLRRMTFVQGVKSFFTCPCSPLASPVHLLDCWGILLRQLYEEPALVLILDSLFEGSKSVSQVQTEDTFQATKKDPKSTKAVSKDYSKKLPTWMDGIGTRSRLEDVTGDCMNNWWAERGRMLDLGEGG